MTDNERNVNMTPVLFGNINQRGQLEDGDKDYITLNHLEDCRINDFNKNIDNIFYQSNAPANATLTSDGYLIESDCVNPTEFYDDEVLEDDIYKKNKITISIYEDDEDDNDDCVIIEQPENHMDKIPPLNSNFQLNNSANFSNIQLNQNLNNLNAPLASILPQEYANVDIQSMYPTFQNDTIPRWNELMNSFQEPQIYNAFDHLKDSSDNIYNNHTSESQNYVYDDYGMNKGIMPQNEIIMSNDADIFSLPAKSFEDCRVPNPFQNRQLCTDYSNITQKNNISHNPDSSKNLPKEVNFHQEIKRKRKRYDRLTKFKNNITEESNTSKIEFLTGLSWRCGPASYWYNVYNVPLDENILDYRIKSNVLSDSDNILSIAKLESLNDDDCLFSTWQLVNWENDIIIEIENSRNEIIESNKKNSCHAGWIPSSKHTNMASFQDSTSGDYFGIWPSSSTGTLHVHPNASQWRSVFALENSQMSDYNWVNKIIIDPRHQNAQEPYLLELDLNNECIHFDFTNPQQTKEILISELNNVYLTSSNTEQQHSTEPNDTKTYDIDTQITGDVLSKEKSKKLKILNKLTVWNDKIEKPIEAKVEPILNDKLTIVKYIDRDTYIKYSDHVTKTGFHMDVFENNTSDIADMDSPLIQHGILHSLSAIQLDPTFFPLKLENQYLRHMHRFHLTDVKQSMIPLYITPQPIYNLMDIVKVESDQRQKICQLTGNGDLFFMRTINDLSACTDHIVLAEYSEEYPPLMMQTGMATRVTNYFHGQFNQPVIMPQLPYGDLCVSPRIPFLGQLSNNQIFQALENNMFRAPIYPHKLKPTDFLIIIKANTLSIRRVNDVFLVGQELPLMKVPAPNSKEANSFIKDFMQVQMIRLFLRSQNNPKTIRHDELKSMFAEQSDAAIRKRLKIIAEYKKSDAGSNSGYWVLKSEVQLPTEDELVELITPEECCAYFSMMSGLCRLEDAGYNSKNFIQADPEQQDDDDDKDGNLKIEDEVKAAPWHTTKTFLDCLKGKCHLELIGAIDPSGCGEAFSYAKFSAKGTLLKETLKNKMNKPSNLFDTHAPILGKRSVTGTDADLRKLTLKKAYSLLKECGLSEHDFKKLKRWDIIDLVRQMSTQKASQGDEEAMTKFARLSKLTVEGQEEKYKKECQRIFNLQNQVLANDDELTSDDGESDVEDEICDDFGKSIFNDANNRKKNRNEMDLFKCKKRFDLISELNCIANGSDRSYTCIASTDNARNILGFKAPVPKAVPKALCIRRQIESSDGTKVTHCQTIPWSSIVKIYFKMNEEYDTEYLRKFSGLNISKEVEKKAQRKQQEQIRRLKRKQKANINLGHSNLIDANNVVKKYRPKVLPSGKLKMKIQTTESLINVVCGSCGNKGHMRTNKDCPLYGKSMKNALAQRKLFKPIKRPAPKVKIKSVITQQEIITSVVPVNIDFINLSLDNDNVKETESRLSDTDSVGEQIISELVNANCSNKDIPVETSIIPEIVNDPETVSLKIVISKQSESQYSISNDINVSQEPIIDNQKKQPTPTIYSTDCINVNKRKLHPTDKKLVTPKLLPLLSDARQSEIMLEQKMRNNRRRVNPLVALNHQFEEIYKGLLQVSGYRCFLYPVREKEYPNYYTIIDYPMDLSTVKMRINKNYYESRESFLQDIKLIYDNCLKFNGENNEFSSTAKKLMSHVMEQFCAKERKLMRLEQLANPLMDEDDMVGMRYILEQTVNAMEEVEYSRPFFAPVNKKKYPDYLEKITNPMDFQTLRSNIKADKYKSREDFLIDVELILSNCITYNGEDSFLTNVCQKVLATVNHIFHVKESILTTLEANLKILLDDASDSQIAPSSYANDQLSHTGDDPMYEEITSEVDSLTVPVKRQRLSESFEEEKLCAIPTGASVDANRERIMADLQLTDSDDDDANPVHISACIKSESEDRIPRMVGFQPINDRLRDHSTSLEDKSNLYHYQNSENNSEAQESPAHVTFYISDDD